MFSEHFCANVFAFVPLWSCVCSRNNISEGCFRLFYFFYLDFNFIFIFVWNEYETFHFVANLFPINYFNEERKFAKIVWIKREKVHTTSTSTKPISVRIKVTQLYDGQFKWECSDNPRRHLQTKLNRCKLWIAVIQSKLDSNNVFRFSFCDFFFANLMQKKKLHHVDRC